MKTATFPPYTVPIGTPDPEEEWLFPDESPSCNTAIDCEVQVVNPEIAEKGGYLDRHLGNVRRPSLFAYLAPPEQRNGAAVVICPGGGYQALAFDKEGADLARFFNSFGVSAFVLRYHLSWDGERPGAYPNAPLRAAQRALRLIRSRSTKYGLCPDKIGIMGFSAGAHLAATASTLYEEQEETQAELTAISARPDFTMLIYPVITFTGPATHLGSRRNLLGEQPSEELKRKFSPEMQVTSDTPPAFLAQAFDDGVSVENSILYFSALKAAGVPAEMHIYPEGGHGYGMRQRGMTIDSWPERMKEWTLKQILN